MKFIVFAIIALLALTSASALQTAHIELKEYGVGAELLVHIGKTKEAPKINIVGINTDNNPKSLVISVNNVTKTVVEHQTRSIEGVRFTVKSIYNTPTRSEGVFCTNK